MLKELAVFLLIYLVALAAHTLPHKWQAWRIRCALRKAECEADADGLNSISPLYIPPASHIAHAVPSTVHHHWSALIIAVVSNPATAASVKEYVLHFLVYSGHVIK